jgi:NADH-quinone oxidoreductase subunit N
MYMKDPVEEFDWLRVTPPIGLAIALSVLGVMIPGVVPSFLMELAQKAISM